MALQDQLLTLGFFSCGQILLDGDTESKEKEILFPNFPESLGSRPHWWWEICLRGSLFSYPSSNAWPFCLFPAITLLVCFFQGRWKRNLSSTTLVYVILPQKALSESSLPFPQADSIGEETTVSEFPILLFQCWCIFWLSISEFCRSQEEQMHSQF